MGCGRTAARSRARPARAGRSRAPATDEASPKLPNGYSKRDLTDAKVLHLKVNQERAKPFKLFSNQDECFAELEQLGKDLATGPLKPVWAECKRLGRGQDLLFVIGSWGCWPAGPFGCSAFGSLAGPHSRVGTRLARAAIHSVSLFRSNLMEASAEDGMRDGAVTGFLRDLVMHFKVVRR